ncbi:hypothetical protein V1291_003789 [Nitrobacteraceae bacterium AZCC 1564]
MIGEIKIGKMAALTRPWNPAKGKVVRLGFKASITALFVFLVLAIGLTLVYLSFSRISSITEAAASKFIDKVAELSADRIGSQLKLIKDNLEILRDLPSIQAGAVNNGQQLNPLFAAMLENNQQLFISMSGMRTARSLNWMRSTEPERALG